jgi:hypothetical protein
LSLFIFLSFILNHNFAIDCIFHHCFSVIFIFLSFFLTFCLSFFFFMSLFLPLTQKSCSLRFLFLFRFHFKFQTHFLSKPKNEQIGAKTISCLLLRIPSNDYSFIFEIMVPSIFFPF